MLTRDYDYELPPELIAQEPSPERDGSRLLVVNRRDGSMVHDIFSHIGRYLQPGDVLVANRSRVIPTRLHACRPTGGRVELLLLRARGPDTWTALAKPSRKLRPGLHLSFEGTTLQADIGRPCGDGEWEIRFHGADDVAAALQQVATLALPPYIRNQNISGDRYQTVYADREGSVAAPTAGLHFSPQLIESLARQGVETHLVTLHVGIGTFRPMTSDRVEEHRMHAEWGEVPPSVVDAVRAAKKRGSRVVAVGTTSTRLLETASAGGSIQPFCGDTTLFIYPPFTFHVVDALVTNFHLPRSSLLLLVSAFAGRDRILTAYAEAIRERYRFFSFGDAMLLL